MFIQSLESGIIPECLKRTDIVRIYKSGDKSLPSNYRPISLTFILMNMIEKIVKKQVTQFLTEKGYLNSIQHGFREGKSCLSALLSVYDDLMLMFTESSCSVDMIYYFDFSKAFDKVDHTYRKFLPGQNKTISYYIQTKQLALCSRQTLQNIRAIWT